MDEVRLAAEQRARVLIDRQLTAAGWVVQDRKDLNLFAAQGIAVRETTMAKGHGRADYLLYVDQQAVGVIEAKPQGTTLSGVEWQSAMYAEGLPAEIRLKALTVAGRLPFVFEASGSETHFTFGYDPEPRARRIFAFPRPNTLARLLRAAQTNPERPTWRAKVQALPPLDTSGLRPAQITAIEGIGRSLREQRFDRSLVQMATGAGKTYTAVTSSYRLLKHGGFGRVLFLVDRNNLADQTLAEFQNYRTPDDGRRFTEIYNVDKLTGAGMLASSHVVVSTIQRVHRALSGHEVADPDDPGLDDYVPDAPVTAVYNPAFPPETFDLVIVDEAHRSIYGLWQGVLTYFDAHIVGLTATPGKQTFGFFRQNLVSEYTYPQSVADGVNVDFDLYRIKTQIPSRARTSTPEPWCRGWIGARGCSGWRRWTKTWSTPAASSTVPSPPPRRSAQCWRRSGTSCSPRSSPAAAPCPRRSCFVRTTRMPRRSSPRCGRCSARATTSPRRSPTTPATPRASCRRSAPRRRCASRSPST